ncbi:hypothetical protein [Phenylobacterium sp.]|uniref:hypothetical protein n=1 Tax=Phenylobacterium sp. TaxID=1871053 RepID=UPI002F41A26E
MKVRPVVRFEADFPDDSICDEDGFVIGWGGRNVVDAISEVLRKAGYALTEPEEEPEHGWTFHANRHGTEVWFQVQAAGEYYLDTVHMGLFKFTRKSKQAYVNTLNLINAWIQQDPRFRNIHWHTMGMPPEEMGTSGPVVEA